MAVVVVGGQTRNIGKTAVVAGLIARLPEFHWTAFKITQYGHGFCTADGKPCQCQTEDACIAINPERDPASGTDTSRFLAAGAVRSLWVRTRIGGLAEAMPRIHEELAASENAILESNSILDFLDPDLYLTVVDPSIADFKDSARRFLPQADAILVVAHATPAPEVPLLRDAAFARTPRFSVGPPDYVTADLIAFVRTRLAQLAPA